MIHNIIFDFGDIFIDLDKPATLNSMKGLGLEKVTKEMNIINQEYEKGLINTDQFIAFYQGKFPKANRQDLIDTWNAIILDFPEHRLQFIESLAQKKKYRLFLLSNTNKLHIDKVIERTELSRYNRFKNCFDQFYLSHEIHLRKPDLNIYNYVINQNNLSVENTLFIDDTKENTDAAKALGLKTWNLTPSIEDIVDLFNKNIL